jgi:hypothetical protein
VDDVTFEELRGALAPEREVTARTGALYLLDEALAEEDAAADTGREADERLGPLFATLLRDRFSEVSAASAALALKRPWLRKLLERDLTRAWQLGKPDYRMLLLQAADGAALGEIAQQCAESNDAALKLGLLSRVHEITDAPKRLDAALYLTHDGDAEIQARALEALARDAAALSEFRGPARAAALRLAPSSAVAVRKAAVRAISAACLPDEAREQLTKLIGDPDFDIREIAVELMREAQGRINLAAVEPLVARQKELVDAGDYNKAMAVAAQVFMRVADHGGCQFQMARAAAGLGDTRRALHLLANALQAGWNGDGARGAKQTAAAEPLFAAARQAEAWAEVMRFAKS